MEAGSLSLDRPPNCLFDQFIAPRVEQLGGNLRTILGGYVSPPNAPASRWPLQPGTPDTLAQTRRSASTAVAPDHHGSVLLPSHSSRQILVQRDAIARPLLSPDQQVPRYRASLILELTRLVFDVRKDALIADEKLLPIQSLVPCHATFGGIAKLRHRYQYRSI